MMEEYIEIRYTEFSKLSLSLSLSQLKLIYVVVAVVVAYRTISTNTQI
jgi:hypothetical protein